MFETDIAGVLEVVAVVVVVKAEESIINNCISGNMQYVKSEIKDQFRKLRYITNPSLMCR